MGKIKFYGSQLWPECQPLKALLLEKNIPFEYIEITESIGNLKKFLKLRDTMKGFQLAKRSHSVGVPALVIGDEVILNITNKVIKNLEEMKERQIDEK